jgi:hypothetical protein
VGGHVFWRNPNLGLFGLYGSHSHWNEFTGVTVNHTGPEAEWYIGRWTIQGVAGVEFGNSASGQVGANIVTFDITTRFFDQIDFSYYLNDSLKAFVGHRFLGGKHAVAAGGEWGLPLGAGAMGSLFVEGRYGENNATGVWGGIRFYFGHHDKPLIRRHREDDPINWEPGNTGTPANSKPAPITCCPAVTDIDLAPGAQLAEVIAVRGNCCQLGLNLTPGAQLAENAVTEDTMMAGRPLCQCPA